MHKFSTFVLLHQILRKEKNQKATSHPTTAFLKQNNIIYSTIAYCLDCEKQSPPLAIDLPTGEYSNDFSIY